MNAIKYAVLVMKEGRIDPYQVLVVDKVVEALDLMQALFDVYECREGHAIKGQVLYNGSVIDELSW